MAEFHGLAARITLALVLVISGWAVMLAVTRRSIPPILLGGLVWALIMLALSGLAGVATALAVAPPGDPLHIVYGLLAVAVLPGAWGIAGLRRDPRRTVVVLAIASVVLLILVVRLFQTGG